MNTEPLRIGSVVFLKHQGQTETVTSRTNNMFYLNVDMKRTHQ